MEMRRRHGHSAKEVKTNEDLAEWTTTTEHSQEEDSIPTTSQPSSLVSYYDFWSLALQYLSASFAYLYETVMAYLPWQHSQLDENTKERMEQFHSYIAVRYDSQAGEHEELLLILWDLSYPEEKLDSRKTQKWKRLGFQGTDPSTDFRGGGLFALKNLLYFARKYPKQYHRVKEGKHHQEPFPLAITGMNLTMLLYELLGWGMKPLKYSEMSSTTRAAQNKLIELLFKEGAVEEEEEEEEEEGEEERDIQLTRLVDSREHLVFHEIYCNLFQLFDEEWLRSGATTLDFNEVLQRVKTKMEKQLNTSSDTLQSIVQQNKKKELN